MKTKMLTRETRASIHASYLPRSRSLSDVPLMGEASQMFPQWDMRLRCLLNERCLSDVCSTWYACHMFPPWNICLSDVLHMPLKWDKRLRCLAKACYMPSQKNIRGMKCLILGMDATSHTYIYIYMPLAATRAHLLHKESEMHNSNVYTLLHLSHKVLN